MVSVLNNTVELLSPSLMPSEKSYLERALRGRALWVPQSRPQWLAFLSRADELFYGGAAGGGKTDLGLGLAFECHQHATFFRREYTQLTDVVDRGDEITAPLGIKFNHQRRRWECGKRFVQLGAIDQPGDVQKYQGRPRDLYVFDEVSFFMEAWVRYITGWRRSTDPGQRTRVLMLGNPPTTPEGEWIVQYFAPWLDEKYPNPARPGELRWFAVIDDRSTEVDGPEPIQHKGETIRPLSRTFIPAYLHDNPFLRDTPYGDVLRALPDELKQKFLDGKFNVKTPDNPWQVIPTAWVEAAQERWKQCKRPDVNLRCCGLDVSRGGDDMTVLARLYHEWFELDAWEGKAVPDGPTAANLVMNATLDETPAPFFVDVIGVGSSVYDSLAGREGVTAYPVNVAEGSKARDKTGKFPFANLRAQVHWQFREALDPNSGFLIALPPDRRVKVDLCAAHFRIAKDGIQVESKEDIKKRLGFSPDYGDAILLGWYGANSALTGDLMV
jgi:hypothetical protein